ncbi:hypothetical protein FKM82_013149 [Ascaphus truei]
MDCTIKEALSVVSEDHTLFSPLLLKTEMPEDYSPSIKERGTLPEHHWVSPSDRQHSIKQEAEERSVSRLPSGGGSLLRVDKSEVDSDGPHTNYQTSYHDNQNIGPTAPSQANGSEEKRVIVPADPMVWTHEHVAQWLDWAVKEYGLCDVDSSMMLGVDGKELCRMSREDFLRLASSYSADILMSHLAYLRQNSPTFTYSSVPTVPAQQVTPRNHVKTEPLYEDVRRINWNTTAGSIHRGSPPETPGITSTGSTNRSSQDPYQVLGPTSSRLSNPGSGQIQFVAVPPGAPL